MDRNYYRNNSYLSRYASIRPKGAKGFKGVNESLINTIANQFIICAALCLAVIILCNFSGSFIDKVLGGIKWVVEEDYDFKAASRAIENYIPGLGVSLKDTPETAEGLLGDTDAVEVSSTGLYYMMAMPVDGVITSGFGIREDPITKDISQHSGIDIDGEAGTPIRAAMDGIVKKVEENDTLGKSVRILHIDGFETLYGHCSEVLVKENQEVLKGDFIGKVGDTGTSTSAHLHFEVIKDGEPIDPLSMIEGLKEPR